MSAPPREPRNENEAEQAHQPPARSRPARWWRRWTVWLAGVGSVVGVSVLGALIRELVVSVTGDVLLDALSRGVWIRWLIGAAVVALLVVVVAGLLHQPRWRERAQPAHPPAGPPQLPPEVSPLVGRRAELDTLATLVGTARIIAVVGRRAVGTSTFALHAARQVAERFPDGAVYLDLRGPEGRPPLSGEQALRAVLRKLGLAEPRSNRRVDVDAAVDSLTAWLAGRRVLLLLDNIDEPAQVRPLLSSELSESAGGCLTLLVGDPALGTLPGVSPVRLSELDPDDAVELLTAVAGTAVISDVEAARRLVKLCAHQPLAIRVLGRLIHQRAWSVREVLAAIEDGLSTSPYTRRLGGSLGGSEVFWRQWDACDIAYHQLAPAPRRLFRLLALVPTTEIGAPAAAALARLDTPDAERLLEELVAQDLLESAAPGRYRIRQLLVGSARYHLTHEEPVRRRIRAYRRLIQHAALIAQEYASTVAPMSRHRGVDAAQASDDASAWFAAEHDLLFLLVTNQAVVGAEPAARLPASVARWQGRLAMALCTWYAAERRLTDWRAAAEGVLSSRLPAWTAITDADLTSRLRRQDRAVVSWALNELGAVHRMQGNPEVARNVLTAARRLRTGWRSRGLAQVETNLGLTLLDLGEHDHAVHHLVDGRILRARGDHRGRALSDLGLGLAYLVGHRYGEAHVHLQEAANTWTALDDRHMRAAAINTLGLVLWEQGDRYGALEHWHRARELYDQVGDALGRARAMLNIAAALLAAHPHRAKEAVELLTESLRLRAEQPESLGAGLCHLHLADAWARSGDAARARDHRRHAARILAHSATPVAERARARLRAADAGDHARR